MQPILFKLGPVTVYSYGLFVALAFTIGTYMIFRGSPKYGVPKDKLWDLIFCILISGLVGARLLHVVLNLEYYRKIPLQILMFHKGGLAIHGGIIFALLASIIFVLKRGLPLWKTGDLIMQYLPLGQAIGRIGCLFNGCCYGKTTTSFLGIIFPGEGFARYPTQAYSSIALIAAYLFLSYLSNKKDRFGGQIFLTYFLIYSAIRFVIDFLRGDISVVLLGLTASQLISVIIFTAALSIYWFKARRIKR